jgi:hypothetical protein
VILDNEVFVGELDVFGVDGNRVLEMALQVGLIVDGASEEEDLLVGAEAGVADSLEVGLSLGYEGIVVEVISYAAVAGKYLLLP